MSRRIDVLEIANRLKRESDSMLGENIAEIIQQAMSGNLPNVEAISQTTVAFKSNMEVFIVSLLQAVVDELQQDS